MRKRMLTLLVCLALLLAAAPVRTAAAEVPYQTYTYDKWGVATPAPNGYIPTRSIGGAQLGCGDFSGAMDLYYCREQGRIYVSDTGNSRIVILDEKMQFLSELRELTCADGSTYSLDKPQGVFVDKNGSVYICDTGNQNVVECTMDGRMIALVSQPESDLLPDNFVYQPTKIVVDDIGRMYIISKGTYQGLIYLDTDGSFIKFFGPNEVEMTFRRRVLQIWKNLLSDEAAATLQSFNPIEYGNIFLSSDGYAAEDSLSLCDAFVFCGGARFYPYHFQVMEYAAKSGKPVLGICLGMQMMNTYFLVAEEAERRGWDGPLLALFEQMKKERYMFTEPVDGHWDGHITRDNVERFKHPVHVTPGSRLERLTGKQTILGASMHNYRITNPARSLTVAGRTDDGTIEALEYGEQMLGVQFHPEADDQNDELFRAIL